ITADERKQMIAEIAALPGLVKDAVRGLGDEQLDTTYREGGWTVRQVIHHIADSHINGYARMRLILTEEEPTLKTDDQDKWAALPDYQLPVDVSMLLLDGLHWRWVRMLERVPNDSWGRTANHPEDGPVTLEKLLKIYAWHGRHHVEQVTRLRQEKGW